MKKYIIKNCPAFNKFTKQCKGAYRKDIEYQYCSGNESCVTKQIVEKCKPCLDIENYGSSYFLASDIVELLEIEEVNE